MSWPGPKVPIDTTSRGGKTRLLVSDIVSHGIFSLMLRELKKITRQLSYITNEEERED